MKFSIIFLVFAAVIAFAYADCDIKGKKVKSGETYNPIGECVTYKCNGDGYSALTCAAQAYPETCHETKVDLTKPYPHCCPKVVC